MLVQRQTPSVQVFNRFGSGMLSFQYIFLSTNNICPIVVSYFPVSVLASMHACAVRYSAWVVFNADGSLEIYIKKIKESQHLFMYKIIISENSPVLFGYFVLARMRACTILWKNQCSRYFGKLIKQSDPIRICRNDPP